MALKRTVTSFTARRHTKEEGPVLLEEGYALLEALVTEAPLVVEAVQRIEP